MDEDKDAEIARLTRERDNARKIAVRQTNDARAALDRIQRLRAEITALRTRAERAETALVRLETWLTELRNNSLVHAMLPGLRPDIDALLAPPEPSAPCATAGSAPAGMTVPATDVGGRCFGYPDTCPICGGAS